MTGFDVTFSGGGEETSHFTNSAGGGSALTEVAWLDWVLLCVRDTFYGGTGDGVEVCDVKLRPMLEDTDAIPCFAKYDDER